MAIWFQLSSLYSCQQVFVRSYIAFRCFFARANWWLDICWMVYVYYLLFVRWVHHFVSKIYIFSTPINVTLDNPLANNVYVDYTLSVWHYWFWVIQTGHLLCDVPKGSRVLQPKQTIGHGNLVKRCPLFIAEKYIRNPNVVYAFGA